MSYSILVRFNANISLWIYINIYKLHDIFIKYNTFGVEISDTVLNWGGGE